jgi:hypothetical protein
MFNRETPFSLVGFKGALHGKFNSINWLHKSTTSHDFPAKSSFLFSSFYQLLDGIERTDDFFQF